ncbi:MAG: hydroxymethylglutaryl-CoA lyase [Deltaproteobacteria bacterium]|nr:hydroxymethylglutaryl-CoA lyase [Deltaproteobacteria bacterium]
MSGDDVHIYEVGLRDGLQNEAAFVPTAEKIALAEMLAGAGLQRIELTSFVSPRWIPQLADHATVAAETPRHAGVTYSALVPNLKGLDGAVDAKLTEIAVFMSASETHNQKNINKSIAEAMAVLGEVVSAAKARGLRVRGYLSTVFGCPYEGKVDPERVADLVPQLMAMGIYELSLGDTIGVANPRQVERVVARLAQDTPVEKLALHMHDTRGTALANVLAGLGAGIRTFDSAFGGLGGCPYAPGASGNLATEDLVYMLEEMGHPTGVDLDRVVDASMRVTGLVGRTLPSKALQAEIALREKRENAPEKTRAKSKPRASAAARR